MSNETNNLKLFKYDPINDGNSTFNIDKALNENWDKIDEDIHTIKSDFDDYKKDYTANNGFGKTSGTSTSYILILNPEPTSYKDGMQITIVPHVDNTTNPTLNINNLGASSILKSDGTAPKEGQIKANKPLSLVRVGNIFFISSSGDYNVGDILPSSSLSVIPSEIKFNDVWSTQISETYKPEYLTSNGDRVYIVSNLNNKGANNYRLTAKSSETGNILWEVNLSTTTFIYSLISDSTGIYVGGVPMIEKFSTTGLKCWGTPGDNLVFSLNLNNSLFVSTANGSTMCINPTTGELTWKFKERNIWHTSVCSVNQNVYIGCESGYIYKLDFAGNKIKEVNLFGYDGNDKITNYYIKHIRFLDDSIYALSIGGSLFKSDFNLQQRWMIQLPGNGYLCDTMYNSELKMLIVITAGGDIYGVSTKDGSYIGISSKSFNASQLRQDSGYIFRFSDKSLVKSKLEFGENSYKITK